MTNHEKTEPTVRDLTQEELDSIERVSVEPRAGTKEYEPVTETKKPEDYDFSAYRPDVSVKEGIPGFERAPDVFNHAELTSIDEKLKRALRDELPDVQADRESLLAQILNELANRVVQRCKSLEAWRLLDAEVRTMTISAVVENWLESTQSRGKRL